MEVRGESQSGPSCSSSSRDGSGVSVSKELLMAGSGGRGGIWDRLLINPKPNSRKNSTLQTVRIERSPLLDQVRTFLPQMAQANEKLRKEMATAQPGHFNIENTDETLGQVIQMVKAFLVHELHENRQGAGFALQAMVCQLLLKNISSTKDVALFEMNPSHSKEEDSSEENSQDSSEDSSESEDEGDSTSSEGEVTIDNIKLPHSEDGKGKIEVLDGSASGNKEKQENK